MRRCNLKVDNRAYDFPHTGHFLGPSSMRCSLESTLGDPTTAGFTNLCMYGGNDRRNGTPLPYSTGAGPKAGMPVGGGPGRYGEERDLGGNKPWPWLKWRKPGGK